jgi:hypothetical protein
VSPHLDGESSVGKVVELLEPLAHLVGVRVRVRVRVRV